MLNRFKYIMLIAMSMIMVSCGSKKQDNKTVESGFSEEFLKNIKTCSVELQNIEQQLKLTGKVECDPDLRIPYIPLVAGVVMNTSFNLGDKVIKGQTMAVIKSSELSAVYAEKQNLEAETKILNRNLESIRSMYHDNLSSQKEMTEAEERLKQTQSELAKANSNLSFYGTQGNDGTFIIKAPISGFVTERNIAPGTQISTDNGPLFTITDINKVWITANVYAGNLAFVKQGMSVDIRTMAYPDNIFKGKIDVIPQVFDSEEHVLKARIIIPNPDLKLKPEMAVDLTLKDSKDIKMATIPSDALIFDNNRYFVIKQDGDSYSVVEVKLYEQNNGTSYLESGVSQGDKIVVENQLLMYNKLKN